MKNRKWEILASTIILSFSLTFYAINTAYSQAVDYISSYFSGYYSNGGMIYGYNGLADGMQDGTLSPGIDDLITYAIFNQISGNYQAIGNSMGLFNQSFVYVPGISDYQSPKLSIQKCLQERPDLDTSRCIMFHRTPGLSVYTGSFPGYIGDKMGSSLQLQAIPSTDYLSLYFICFEGCE